MRRQRAVRFLVNQLVDLLNQEREMIKNVEWNEQKKKEGKQTLLEL